MEMDKIERSDVEGQSIQLSENSNMSQKVAPLDEITEANEQSHDSLESIEGSEEESEKMIAVKKKVGIMIIVGLFVITFGGTCVWLWPSLFNDIVQKELVLSPNSTSFKMWKETPVPMYLKIYMYNWTNHKESLKDLSKKPHFEQMGPYVFQEIDYKVNKTWNENGTITFLQKRVWHFLPSLSNGSLSDMVTNLNPVAATIAYNIRYGDEWYKFIANQALKLYETIVITTSVKQILFDGIQDKLLKFAVDHNFTKIPFDKFAWFYKRNDSETYDGTFNMLTGVNNIHELGIIKEWKYQNISPYYPKTCGPLKGTNGDLWPPLINNKTVSIFSPDVCTTLSLKSAGASSWLGLTGSKYVSDADIFDNGTKVESRKCYCEGVDCQPSGTLNISLCKYEAPAFVSLPHFYLADESYRQVISGMNPKKEDHEFVLVVQPDTGIPMQVKASLQINFLVQPDKHLSFFEKIPKMYVPMLWFTQEVNLTANYASQAKILVIASPLVIGISFSLVAIGILLNLIALFMYVRQRMEDNQNENLIPKENKDKDGEVNVSNKD